MKKVESKKAVDTYRVSRVNFGVDGSVRSVEAKKVVFVPFLKKIEKLQEEYQEVINKSKSQRVQDIFGEKIVTLTIIKNDFLFCFSELEKKGFCSVCGFRAEKKCNPDVVLLSDVVKCLGEMQ